MSTAATSKPSRGRTSAVLALGAFVLAAAGGCSGAPAAPKEPPPADAAARPANASAGEGAEGKSGIGLQFDNGSHDLRKADGTLVGTAFVNSLGPVYKEIWVLSTTAGNVACTATNCDISGLPIRQRSTKETCATWESHATALTDRKVLGVTFEADALRCESCNYVPEGPTHTFSLFPAGRHAQCGSQSPRVFVETAGASVREYWIMSSKIGIGGGTISTLKNNDDTRSAFACGACVDTDLTIFKVTYTDLEGRIDCSTIAPP